MSWKRPCMLRRYDLHAHPAVCSSRQHGLLSNAPSRDERPLPTTTCSMRSRELDSMILMGPFQLDIFYDSGSSFELLRAGHRESFSRLCSISSVAAGDLPVWQERLGKHPVTHSGRQGAFRLPATWVRPSKDQLSTTVPGILQPFAQRVC